MKILTSIMMMALSFSAIAKPKADIAFIIDTSGSMQGLINQVRDGVWSTLNNLGEIKKNGDIAELRLALYEYGSGVVSSEANFIQLLVPLTTDHMSVAEKLFATKAIGSQEYSGMAIKLATENLDFSKSINDFKSIILAGNETIHQGPVDPLLASSEALDKDILINTIYAGSQTRTVFNSGGTGGFGCGFRICQPTPTPIPSDPQTELNPEFAEFMELAKVGGGMTLNIDQNNSIPFVSSPYDEKIIFTTEAITETYLPFGKTGQDQYDRMRNLDRQVRGSSSGSYIGWGNYRSGNYGQGNAASWDLVSASRDNSLDLNMIEDKNLPKEMQGLSLQEKIILVERMDLKRKILEDEVVNLKAKRKKFVDAKLAAMNNGKDPVADFTKAIKKILVNQLKAKGFEVIEK